MYGWCVFNAHWHYDPFVQSPWRVDRSELNVVRVHAGLEKTVRHIDGSKEVCSSAVRENF